MQSSHMSAATSWHIKAQPCAHAMPSRRQLRLACRAARSGNSASAVADKLGSLFSKVGKKAEEEEDRCARSPSVVLLPGRLVGWGVNPMSRCDDTGLNTISQTRGGCE